MRRLSWRLKDCLSNTQKKKKARKLKSTEREEKKNSHITRANLPNKSQQPPVVSTLPTAQTSNLVPSSSSEKVGGATLTRLKPKEKEQLVEQDRALYVGLPRGEKSVGAAAALAQALLVRLKKLRIPIESASPASPKFVIASLLLSGVTMGRKIWEGPNARRRWRILFGEALWTIWLQKCRWSHKDAKFDPPAVLSVFSEALKLRIGRDRLYARSTVKKAKREQFLELWGFTVDSPSLPIWISH